MPISQINTNSIASSTGLTTPTIAQINSAASLTPTTFYDNAGVQIGTLCRAWVSYNSNTQTIIGSFNISSITYTTTGTFVANFTNALPDAKYAVVGSCATVFGGVSVGSGLYTTTTFGFNTYNSSSALVNQPYNTIAVFR